MRIRTIYFLCVIIFANLALSVNAQNKEAIKFGEARFSGVIKGNIPDSENVKDFIITVSNAVTSERINYDVKIDDDGSFAIRVPVVGETYGGLLSPFYQGVVPLIPNEETRMEIHYDDKGEKSLSIKSKSEISAKDSQKIMETIQEVVYTVTIIGDDYTYTPEEYSSIIINGLDSIANSVQNRNDISQKAKDIIINELKLFYLTSSLLEYKGSMERRYINAHNDNKSGLDELEIVEPDLQYYSFLKYFDLDNMEQLSSSYYFFTLQAILNHPAFNIEPIGETSIDVWIDGVKNSIGELLDADSDFVYQLLASASYSAQLGDLLGEVKPLSKKQIENIKTYFSEKNSSLVDILLTHSANFIELSEDNKKYTINETPSVDKDEVLNSIVSKYKGKVVVVDFWATWCGPCLAAMKESVALKNAYNIEDVVFVYFTSPSSPKAAWEKAVKNIGGEHYYLDSDIWYYISEQYDRGGIPFYMIFDKQGELIHKQSSYMGNDKLKILIDGLL